MSPVLMTSVAAQAAPTDAPQLIRVGLVEDDPATSASFVAILSAAPELALQMVAFNLADALRQLEHTPLDVLLVDLGLPDGSGLDLIRAACLRWPDCAVMVSTIFGDEAHVFSSIEAGASGYLLKDISLDRLVIEILSLHAGGSPISPSVARKILMRARPTVAPASPTAVNLSARESEVLQLISKGFTAEEVAARLAVSQSTVLTFVRRIYAKLQVGSRAEVITAAHRLGLLHEG
ncbi:MAG: response regulator transcription factor [Rhodoferax sp.]